MGLTEECRRLKERASRLCGEGDYAGAKRLWEEALKLSPSDPEALEGHRQASVLAKTMSASADQSSPDTTAKAGSDQVARMLDAGRVAEAMAAARALRASFPDDLAVRQAYKSAQQAYEAEPFIREQITLSRQLMDKGMTMQAGAACRKVLALDDRNREALDLLSQIEDQQAPAAAVVSPGAQNESLGFILEDREEPHDDPTSVLQPLPRAEESVSGGLFEFQQNEEDLDLSLSSMDFGKGGAETGMPSSSTPAGHPGGPPGTDADPAPAGPGRQEAERDIRAPGDPRPAHPASDHAIPEDFEFHAEGEQATS